MMQIRYPRGQFNQWSQVAFVQGLEFGHIPEGPPASRIYELTSPRQADRALDTQPYSQSQPSQPRRETTRITQLTLDTALHKGSTSHQGF